MNVLFVGEDLKEHAQLEALFERRFPDVKIIGFVGRKSLLRHLALDGSFHLMIIDCKAGEDDPVDLSTEVMDLVGQGSFLFIGAGDILERMVMNRVDLQRWNFNICEKPYVQTEFCELIQNILTEEKEDSKKVIKVDAKNYFSIGIKNFYLFEEVPYDAFMEVSSNRFVKAISKDEPYSENIIRHLASRNVRKLFIKKTHHVRFLEESMESAGRLMFQKDVSPIKVFQIQVSSIVLIHQYIRLIGVSDAVVTLVEKVINATAENIGSFENFNDILQMFPYEQRDVPEKSALLLYVCEMIIKSLRWSSEITRKQLGLASIVHDCFIRHEELTNISSLASGEFKRLPKPVKEEFLQHPFKAVELADQFPGFPNVEFIVEEHHELPGGKGFPHKKKMNKISNISCAFIMAVNFVNHLAIDGISNESVGRAIDHFDENYHALFCRQLLECFERSLKSL